VGYESIGIELDPVFFKIAERAIPQLALLEKQGKPRPARARRGAEAEQPSLALPF
jgi:hypothetical protein